MADIIPLADFESRFDKEDYKISKPLISASVMCANHLEILKDLSVLIKEGVDYLHFDIMDGNFVNNLALNLDTLKEIRTLTNIPIDVHLMVKEPSNYFNKLIDYGVKIIIFHAESNENIIENINLLRSKNIKVGLALHLDTPWNFIKEYLEIIDYVLIMNIAETGFSGLAFNRDILKKINQLYSYIQLNNYNTKIISDGGIKFENIEELYYNGADIFVGGSGILFNGLDIKENIRRFRDIKIDIKNRKILKNGELDKNSYSYASLREINDLIILKKELRALKPGEVLVKVMSCGICGSDIVRVFEKGMYSKGLALGHEISGIITSTNPRDSLFLNKRVVVYPLIPCKSCKFCKSGKYNLCENYNYLGSRSDGGFAEYVIVPIENIIEIPDSISYDEASLIEPISVVLHGLKKISNYLIGANVFILGLGPIGILSGLLSKKLGAHEVYGIDKNSFRVSFAKKNGFKDCFSDISMFSNNRINILIECSGSSFLLDESLNLIDKESIILFLANHEKNLILSPKTISKCLRGEYKIFYSWNSLMGESGNTNDWKDCIDYLDKKEIYISELITQKITLSSVLDVMSKMYNCELDYIKVIIKPNGDL